MRRPLFRAGVRGRTVRVAAGVNHGAPCYWVYYRTPDGKRTGKPFPFNAAGKADAIGYAQGVVESQVKPGTAERPRLTVAQLWAEFVGERGRGWRFNTRRIYHEAWAPFEAVAGAHNIAEDVGRSTLAHVAADLETRKLAVNTIQKTMSVVRQVYGFGLEAELIQKNRAGGFRYRVAKEKRPVSPDEYTMEEFGRLIDALPLDRKGTWRAHTVLGVCGYQGARQHAVLHLQWRDVDWAADRIYWRAEWDKNGVEWDQPLRDPTRALLLVAQDWHHRLGIESAWVFPAPRTAGKVYAIQTLWWNLRAAEKRAEIEHRARRAGHGLRRLLAGEVNALTGDAMLAMLSIGDRDIRQANRYLKKRDTRVRGAFDALDAALSSNRQAEAPESNEAAEAAHAAEGLSELPRRDSNPRPGD